VSTDDHERSTAPQDRPPAVGPMLLAAAAGAIPTLAILVIGDLHSVFENQQLRTALDTAQCLIGSLAAYLIYGRFRRTGLLNDLALAGALGLSAATNLFFAVVPAIVGDLEPTAFTTWAPLTARLISALVIAWAAVGRDRPYLADAPPGPTVLGALFGVVAAIASVFWLVGDRLPDGVERSLTPSASGRPSLEGEPVLLATQLLMMGLFVAAAFGFARRSAVDPSPLTTALAAACVLNAFARLNYFLYPSLYTDIVHTGDVLRLGYFLILLAGAAGQIQQYWVHEARSAAAAERRRLARDLHDGLTQELAFIHSQAATLVAERGDDQALGHVSKAAERALDQSRRAVAALTSEPTSVPASIRAALEGLPEAYGASVQVDVHEITLPGESSAALASIAREAVSNALRHGGASRVSVVLAPDSGHVRLTVRDDGSGFTPGQDASPTNGTGLGLRTMRERAELLGGRLEIQSAPGSGTCVEVIVPRRAPVHRRV
jgi:signal transduction histidine kinase